MPKLAKAALPDLLTTLETRFAANKARHKGVDWREVSARAEADLVKAWSLAEMERTGGEPDVVGRDPSGAFVFIDCAAESPAGRRSLCYDREGLLSRKEARPADSAMEVAAAMGVEILSEARYRDLQKIGRFDSKTSSWLATPPAIRRHGGAIFGDYRYGEVFIYHNGAQSYYAARGFRAMLAV